MGRNRPKAGVGVVQQVVNQIPTDGQPIDTAYPYEDGTYYYLYGFPKEVQDMIIGGGNEEAEYVRNASPEEYEIRKGTYQSLGLDIENRVDQQIFADLTSMFSPANGVIARRSINVGYWNRDEINIENLSFSTTKETPDYVGFAMIARQVTAAQEIARRTGMIVHIDVNAAQGGTYSGFSVWPKLGYDFEIPEQLQTLLVEDYGFKENEVDKGTAAFMSTYNRNGYDGYSVWREITENLNLSYSPSGRTTIYPDGRSTPALEVTKEYARQFSKSVKRQQQGVFGNGQLSDEDDAILHEIWMNMRNAKD